MSDPTSTPAASHVSRETLEATPARVLPFLRAIGTRTAIRALMNARGYTPEDHKEGWRLLHAVSGYVEEAPPEGIDVKVRGAIVELDQWDEDGFRLVRAALGRRHPEQAAFVLDGIGPSVGPAAVTGVKTLLVRLDALEKSPERKATRKEDHAALDTLAKRGLDAKERARLAHLVRVAESVSDLPEDDGDRVKKDQAHVEALIALRVWFEEWSEIARVAVKRRDYLILMGLAKRKPSAKGKKGQKGAAKADATPTGSSDAEVKASDAPVKANGAATKASGADSSAG
jgi:hypothetical protein